MTKRVKTSGQNFFRLMDSTWLTNQRKLPSKRSTNEIPRNLVQVSLTVSGPACEVGRTAANVTRYRTYELDDEATVLSERRIQGRLSCKVVLARKMRYNGLIRTPKLKLFKREAKP